MRPTIDLAYRARNWFWYWRVREISGLSNEQLDKKCFGDTGRRRHFERIQASASGPNDVAIINGQTLLTIVDNWDRPSKNEPGPYAIATQEFHSQIWSFLVSRDVAPTVYTEFINSFLTKRNWVRIQKKDKSLYACFLGKNEPAIEPGVSTAYSAMLHMLYNDDSLEATAVLIALFKEALNRIDLEQALAIRIALRATNNSLGVRSCFKSHSHNLLNQLIEDRVLNNFWVTESDWRKITNTSSKLIKSTRERTREFQAFIEWLSSQDRDINNNEYGMYPLVPRSDRTDWLESYKGFLEGIMIQVDCYNYLRHKYSEIDSPIAPYVSDDFIYDTDKLPEHCRPPKSEPVLFYSSKSMKVICQLPCPYPIVKSSNKP